jgi:hypothetical protein
MLARLLHVEHRKFALCERSGRVDLGMTIAFLLQGHESIGDLGADICK